MTGALWPAGYDPRRGAGGTWLAFAQSPRRRPVKRSAASGQVPSDPCTAGRPGLSLSVDAHLFLGRVPDTPVEAR